MKRGTAWLPAARRYFVVIAIGNLMWEFAQLPLYTLWKTDTVGQITYAVFHCTAGDVLIAGITLAGSLLLLGTAEWPRARFFPVAAVTLISGTGITAYIEHLSIARGIWAYSDLMPMLPGTSIGLSPLAQWIVIPALAFVITRSIRPARGLDLPIMGITTSKLTPDNLAPSDRKSS